MAFTPKRFTVIGALSALLALLVPSVTAAEDGATTSFTTERPLPAQPPIVQTAPSPCGQGSWVAGSVEVCAGEVVYRDYVYDDFGASLLPGPAPDYPDDLGFYPALLPPFDGYGALPPVGGQRIGAPDEVDNTTDLVSLRLRRDGARIRVTAELNTVRGPEDARVLLAVDRDNDPATGGGPWPAVVANPLLGRAPSSPGWDGPLVSLGPVAPDTNRATGAFPAPAGGFRIWAVVTDADGVVMNVAFRGTRESGFWWDAAQAAALYTGDLKPFSLEVASADLLPGSTRRASTPAGVILQRVYISGYPIGEGVSTNGVPGPGGGGGPPAGQASTMLGRYQPYGFMLPPGTGPHGVQMLLHGLAENHAGRLYLPGTDASIVDQLGIRYDRILVAPLGRGYRGWYSAHSARDVFDVLGDVTANYSNDRDRWYIGGMSMGGYGALRLGGLFPDLWAGALNWIGHTGDFFNGTPFSDSGGDAGAFGNAVDWVQNLRRVPITNWYSSADELVPVWQALLLRDRLAGTGVESIFWLHAPSDHLLPVFIDDWEKEAAWSEAHAPRRVSRPARVVFRTDPRLFEPELGMVPDHAYWVWSIKPASQGYADVDVRSDGCGESDPRTETRSFTDPSPSPLPVVVGQEEVATGRDQVPVANRLVLATRNVSSFAVDVGAAGACIGPDEVEFEITTDGPVAVTLSDGRVLRVATAGSWKGSIPSLASFVDARPATVNGDPSSLPATGGPPVRTPALAALLALTLALRRISAGGSGPDVRFVRARRPLSRGHR